MGPDFSQEMIRLHINVEALLPEAERHILQFVASRKGEGTSTLARAYAKVAAIEFRKRVLVLDADLGIFEQPHNGVLKRRNKLSAASDRSGDITLAEPSLMPEVAHDHLIDKSLVEPGEEPYFFLPAPMRQPTVASIGQSFLMESLFATLRERFDVVVVDSPPVHKSSYSLVIARQTDGLVLVVEATRTRWPVANSAKHTIIKAGGNVVGMVFNKRRACIPSLLYKRF